MIKFKANPLWCCYDGIGGTGIGSGGIGGHSGEGSPGHGDPSSGQYGGANQVNRAARARARNRSRSTDQDRAKAAAQGNLAAALGIGHAGLIGQGLPGMPSGMSDGLGLLGLPLASFLDIDQVSKEAKALNQLNLLMEDGKLHEDPPLTNSLVKALDPVNRSALVDKAFEMPSVLESSFNFATVPFLSQIASKIGGALAKMSGKLVSEGPDSANAEGGPTLGQERELRNMGFSQSDINKYKQTTGWR